MRGRPHTRAILPSCAGWASHHISGNPTLKYFREFIYIQSHAYASWLCMLCQTCALNQISVGINLTAYVGNVNAADNVLLNAKRHP